MNWLQKLFQKKESDKIKWNHNSWNDCPERGNASYDNPIYNQYANENPEGNDSNLDSAVDHDNKPIENDNVGHGT